MLGPACTSHEPPRGYVSLEGSLSLGLRRTGRRSQTVQLEQLTTVLQWRDSADAVHASATHRDTYFLFKPALQVVLDRAEGHALPVTSSQLQTGCLELFYTLKNLPAVLASSSHLLSLFCPQLCLSSVLGGAVTLFFGQGTQNSNSCKVLLNKMR